MDLQGARRPRIALYSHDTMGLGHVRRNLLIGKTLARSPLSPNVLLLSGATDAKSFYLPEGLDCVTLPSLHKSESGEYRSRRLRMDLSELISFRRAMLESAVLKFDPDILIVDTAPKGVSGELDSVLARLAAEKRATLVLGMRDIWDEPSAIAREWAGKGNWKTIRAYYDQVWVYGDRSVWDVVKEHKIEDDIAGKFTYTGYLRRGLESLDPSLDYAERTPWNVDPPFALCLIGGGQDGIRLAEAFLDAELPAGRTGALITGPFMDPENTKGLRARASRRDRMKVLDFIPEPLSYIMRAESIVSMGGYNAVCEIMSFDKPALIAPRVSPRKEQLIRAEKLSERGILDFIHPGDLDADRVSEFLRGASNRRPPNRPVDMNGLPTITSMVGEILSGKGLEASVESNGKKHE